MSDPTNPLIVQGDLSVLAEVSSPRFDEARAKLARFAELDKAPEHIHTYRITPLSLWNAAVSGLSSGDVAATITGLAKYPVAPSVLAEVHDQMGRYGRLRLVRDHDTAALALTSAEPALLEEVSRDKQVAELLGNRLDGNRFAVRNGDRGVLKQALIRLGWPAADEAGYAKGTRLEGAELTAELRSYQSDALAAWWHEGNIEGGNGVLALPCGAGKTIIGLGAIATAGTHTLIVVTSNYHMPRAIVELSHAMPDIQLIPFAVVGEKWRDEPWWTSGATLRLLLSEYVKYVAAEVRVRLADFGLDLPDLADQPAGSPSPRKPATAQAN